MVGRLWATLIWGHWCIIKIVNPSSLTLTLSLRLLHFFLFQFDALVRLHPLTPFFSLSHHCRRLTQRKCSTSCLPVPCVPVLPSRSPILSILPILYAFPLERSCSHLNDVVVKYCSSCTALVHKYL